MHILANIEDSDTKLTNKLCRCFRGKRKYLYTGEHINGRIAKLHHYCLTHLIDSYRLHINREKGIYRVQLSIEKLYVLFYLQA